MKRLPESIIGWRENCNENTCKAWQEVYAFKGAVPDGKTQDTKGYLVFPVPLAQENSQKPLSGRVILLT